MARASGCSASMPSEHPVALQLGGSDPAKLAEAARIGEDFGYDEINLNVGCPSDRVQSGTFGACLMREPDLVAECVAAMKAAVADPGHRQMPHRRRRAGSRNRARRAWPTPCSQPAPTRSGCMPARPGCRVCRPKENRDIPPLDYGRVYRLKQKFPDRFIGINGGIADAGRGVAASRPCRWRDARPRRLPHTRHARRGRRAVLWRAGRSHSIRTR